MIRVVEAVAIYVGVMAGLAVVAYWWIREKG